MHTCLCDVHIYSNECVYRLTFEPAMECGRPPQVRRAQEAVLSTRPFNEGLQSVFSGLVKRLAIENIELPLLQVRSDS